VTASVRLVVRERVEVLGSAGGLPEWPHSFWAEPNNVGKDDYFIIK
jgi:hypothetical protein